MAAPVIHFDYDFSPYGQKTKLLLHAAGIPFQKNDQPAVLPRPDLEALGITYRRIPLLAVGKDIYADSSLIVDTVLDPALLHGRLPTSPADKAYEVLGSTIFNEILGLIPTAVLTPAFLQDRAAIFPFLNRPDFASLRPSALAQFRARLRELERGPLAAAPGAGPFVHGAHISLADVHLVWPVRWAFANLGVGEADGVGPAQFPKVHAWVAAMPEPKPEVLSAEQTWEKIRGAAYSADDLEGEADEAYGVRKGEEVNVESFDSTPGSYPQAGRFLGANAREFVIEIKDGVRLHFPGVGYIVRPKSFAH